MVALPTLLITPENTRDRNGPVALTESGAVRRVPFDGGQAFFVEEGTTNLDDNPISHDSMHTLGGYPQADRSRITNADLTLPDGNEVNTAARATFNSSTSGHLAQYTSYNTGSIPPVGTWVTSSVYFRCSAGMSGSRIRLELLNISGDMPAAVSSYVDCDTNWQRISVTTQITSTNGLLRAYINIGLGGTDVTGEWIDFTAFQLEAKPYATSFAHGDMGAGYSWTGTPHSSASVREHSKLSVDRSLIDFPSEEGSVYLRFGTGEVHPHTRQIYPLQFGQEGSNGFTFHWPVSGGNRSNLSFWGRSAQTGEYNSAPAPLTWTPNTNISAYAEWGESTFGISVNGGELITRNSRSLLPPSQDLFIGGHSASLRELNGYVAALIAFDRPLAEAEIALLDRIPTRALTWENLVPPTPIPPPPPRPAIIAEMTDLRPYPIMATIAGHPTDVINYNRSHGVDQPVATGSITLPLPLPEHLRGGQPGDVLNLPVSLQVGYRESILRPVFNGYIRRDRMDLSRSGYYATLSMVGYATLLSWPESRDLTFSSNYLDEIIRSLCERRGVPKYRIDRILTPSGARVRMGGNNHIDDGKVIIPAGTSPLDWMTRLLRHFGYRAFDTAQEFRVHRVSGRPTLGPMGEFTEGKLIHRLSRDRDLDDVVTAFTVEGATYTDDDGIQIPIRSIPEGTVPFEPLLNPPGYREQTIRDNQLVTQVNADTVRQIAEIDNATVNPMWSINTRGNSLYRPGATVRIASSNMEATAENYWLMSVKDSLDSRQGYKAVLTAWKGGGSALPDGEDLETINVREAPIHLGDEYVPWYAVPQATGKEFTIPITVPDTFTSLAISLYLHGSNNYLLGEGNTESSVSKIEVSQNGESVGSTELPVSPEDYALRLPYSSGLTHWQQFRLPVPGRLEAGSAEIRIISGEDNRLASHVKFDDFEVAQVRLELRGAGVPELPTQGVT